MEISYRNTLFDHVAFYFYYLSRSPVLLLGIVIIFILYSLTGMGLVLRRFPGGILTVLAFIVIESILVFIIVSHVAAIAIIMAAWVRISRKNRTLFCETSIVLEGETFSVESRYSKSELRWEIVHKPARTQKHIFIYVSRGIALIIPRRAFKSTAQWNKFYWICRQKTSRTA
jgi:hypothetical protein